MAEETKPVVAEAAVPEVAPVVAAPAAEVPAVETKPAEEASAAAVAEHAPEAATETPADAEAPAAADDAKEEEAKPVEEGPLSHKGEGANFPKNLIYNKKLFWFSSDPVELKGFKADKVTDIANHLTAWAAHTGKGLLFFSDKNDKTAITGLIPLSEASEPVAEGPHKFHLTAKGHKHVFKAATPAERDNWVTQIKAKMVEAKDIAIDIQDSETYKKTLDALKPVASKKDEKAAEPAAETAPEVDAAVAPAAEETAETPGEAATEGPKESAAEEPTEEAKPEAAKGSEKRSVSANRKRASLFGLLGVKKEKAPETPAADTPAADPLTAEAAPADAEAPAEAPVDVTDTTAEVAEPTEGKVEEKKKPVPTKRSSIFGNLPFGKKKGEAVTTPNTEESAVATDAPVIPAMATTEPLSTDAPAETAAEAPAETADATAETAVEAKPSESAPKLEKRKSSRPFGFGKKKTETSDDEVESPRLSPFSKFRATIKGNKGKQEKAAETEEAPAVPEVSDEVTEAAPNAEVEPAAEPSAAPVEAAEAASEGAPPASQVVTAAA